MRVLAALSAAATAANVFLLGYPGDLVPQVVLIAVGASAAALAATVAVLSKT